MSVWLFAEQGKPSTPRSAQEIQDLIRTGKLSADTLVWREGLPQWTPARTFPELIPPGVSLPLPMPETALPYATPPGYSGSPKSIGDDAGIRMLIPVGRSGWAIAAGYCGLFALIPLFAPIALIVSIIALIHLKKRPELHGKGRAIFGLVMGVLFTIGPLIIIAIAVTS